MTEPPRLPASWRDRAQAFGFHALGALLVAGVVHVALVLTVPLRTADDAYAWVSALAGGQVMRTAPQPPPDTPILPYRDPAVAASFCLFDLRAGPVRVEMDVAGADYAGVSLHDRHGRSFYGLTNRSASNGKVALVVMTPRQLTEAAARDTGDEPDTDLRVAATEPQGFAEVQVLATRPDALPDARGLAGRLSCSAAKL